MGGKTPRPLGVGDSFFYGIVLLSNTSGCLADTACFRRPQKMVVDGVPNVRTCVTPVREGMDVRTQHGLGEGDVTHE